MTPDSALSRPRNEGPGGCVPWEEYERVWAEAQAARTAEEKRLREAMENVVTAAREVDDFFGGEQGRWTLDRKVVREPLATALLSLHDYLNDVLIARDAIAAHFNPEANR